MPGSRDGAGHVGLLRALGWPDSCGDRKPLRLRNVAVHGAVVGPTSLQPGSRGADEMAHTAGVAISWIEPVGAFDEPV